MRMIRSIMLVALLLIFTGLAVAQDVHTDYDKNVVFERFHTYSWGEVQTTNPLWVSRIQSAVDKTLSAKGWQKIQTGEDVVVTAVGGTKDQQEFQTFYDGLGGWRWQGFGETTTTVENYKVGTLVSDLYDASNKELVWRGTASDTLSGNAEHNEKDMDKAVDKMFKNFHLRPRSN